MRLVVSPHLDDAVLSCGGYLQITHEPVLTVFDGVPEDDGTVTDYDASCGFDTSWQAMMARDAEDACALEVLGCDGMGLGLFDQQYGRERQTMAKTAQAIEEAMRLVAAEGIVAPVGTQHPDHVYVSNACLMLAAHGVPIWLYDELPYRVVWPEHAHARHSELQQLGWQLVPDQLGSGDQWYKAQAVNCYSSQNLDVHCCLAPERYWAVRR